MNSSKSNDKALLKYFPHVFVNLKFAIFRLQKIKGNKKSYKRLSFAFNHGCESDCIEPVSIEIKLLRKMKIST